MQNVLGGAECAAGGAAPGLALITPECRGWHSWRFGQLIGDDIGIVEKKLSFYRRHYTGAECFTMSFTAK